MTSRSNGARRTHRDNENRNYAQRVTSAMSILQAPGFLVSQRFALEAARFWARRIHAYADQMETFAACKSPNEFVTAQAHFIERLQEDYASEAQAFTEIFRSGAQAVEQAQAEVAAE